MARVSVALWALSGCAANARGREASITRESPHTRSESVARFDAFTRSYFAERFRYQPVEGTSNGSHENDARLPDVSRDGTRAYVSWLEAQQRALEALAPSLPETDLAARDDQSDRPRLDAELLRDAIAAELRSLRDWDELSHRPGAYHSLAADAVYQLMLREFAPVDARVRSGVARLRGVAALLAAGEARLQRVSRLSVEVALREIDGSIEMVRDVFPRFAQGASDAALRTEAQAASRQATEALVGHRAFLEALRARADGDFHDGAARWAERVRLTEGVTEGPGPLRDAALAEVRRIQREMRETAARIARPGEDFAATLSRVKHDHPQAGGLLEAYRTRQGAIREFVRTHELAHYDPSRDDLAIEETPGFLRATIFAALSSPGPFETVARRTYFYVTPADTTRPASEIDAYLTEHSYAGIDVTSIHEAYPGHHVQGILQREARSLVRRVLWHGTYGEGWAHYTEQMMVDEGYGDATIKLAQGSDAILRAARAYLDPSVHAFGLTYEDAVRFYRDEAFLSQPGAEMEARRVCINPGTVFVYTYGKFGFYRLRRALAARGPAGAAVSAGAFHDAILRFGSAPLPRLARALYGVELGPWAPGEEPSARPAGR